MTGQNCDWNCPTVAVEHKSEDGNTKAETRNAASACYGLIESKPPTDSNPISLTVLWLPEEWRYFRRERCTNTPEKPYKYHVQQPIDQINLRRLTAITWFRFNYVEAE